MSVPVKKLIDAVKSRDYVAMTNALDNGADVNEKENGTGRTALYYAAMLDMSEFARGRMVDYLLAKKANPNLGDDKGQTPLHAAAQRAGFDIMDKLLAKGADINARTKDGATPLHLAMAVALGNGKTETMQRLLDRGANSLVRDEAGKTALDRAREREGFTNFYATVISFLQEWENKKPADRLRADFAGANAKEQRAAQQDVQQRLRDGSRKFKLKP